MNKLAKEYQSKRVGCKYNNNQGDTFEIVEYYNTHNVTLKFSDGTLLKNKDYNCAINGKYKNYNFPTVYGIGYHGEGKYSSKTHKNIYAFWHQMFRKSYCEEYNKLHKYRVPTTVDKKWHNFQVFAEWFDKNQIENSTIRAIPNCGKYSPETVEFIIFNN